MSYLEMRAVRPICVIDETERGGSDCMVDLTSLRPPQIHEVNHSRSGQSLRRGSEISPSCPVESQSSPRVWIKRVRVRRPMTPSEIAENHELYASIDADRRRHIMDLVILTATFLFLYGVFLTLLFTGVIPFCNK